MIGITKTIAMIGLIMTLFSLLPYASFAQGYSVSIQGHDYTAIPGSTINGIINVNSSRNKVVGITITKGDWWRSLDDQGHYQWIDETGKEPRSLLPWLTYSPEVADLPANGKIVVNYQVRIPNDPLIKGSYWAALFVSSVQSQEELAKLKAKDPSKPTFGIKIVYRYVALITVTISNSEPPSAKFTNIKVVDSENGPQAIVYVENSTLTLVKPKYWIQIKDTSGKTVYQSNKSEFMLLPESNRAVKIRLTDKPIGAGEYLLLIVADYGAPKLIGVQAKVTITPEQAEIMAKLFAELEARKAKESSVAASPAGDQPPGEDGN